MISCAKWILFLSLNYSYRKNPVKFSSSSVPIFFVLTFKEAPIAPLFFKQINSSFFIVISCHWNVIACSVGKSPIVYTTFPKMVMNRIINRDGDLIMFVDARFGRGELIGILEEKYDTL